MKTFYFDLTEQIYLTLLLKVCLWSGRRLRPKSLDERPNPSREADLSSMSMSSASSSTMSRDRLEAVWAAARPRVRGRDTRDLNDDIVNWKLQSEISYPLL